MIRMVFKGMVIGIANIIPGVSGGTMAVSMGIYDKIIHAATHIVSEFKESMRVLIPIILGAAVGVVALARIIEVMFAKAPFQTNLLFIGLIVGGLPAMAGKVKGKSIRGGHILVFLLFFCMVAGMALLGEEEGAAADLTFGFVNVIKLFGVGVVASATMVIPGVSGSMMLMLMGYYTPILEQVNDFIDSLLRADLPAVLEGCQVLVPFGVGVVAGIFAIAKLVEFIFQRFPDYAYWAIIGLIVSSPLAILLMNPMGAVTALGLLAGVIALAAGVVIALKLGEE